MPDVNVPSVLLWGGKSKARIVAEMIREDHLGNVSIIFDAMLDALDFPSDALFVNDGRRLKALLPLTTHFVVCMGGEHGYARHMTAKCLESLGLCPLPMIHPKSFVDPTASVGDGCMLMPGSVLYKFSSVGDQSILNINASVDHECRIGHGVHVMGGAAVAGKVTVEDYATIGTNATVLPFRRIGRGAYVGAGAVVTHDVEENTVVVGVPAKPLRKNEPVFHADVLDLLAR